MLDLRALIEAAKTIIASHKMHAPESSLSVTNNKDMERGFREVMTSNCGFWFHFVSGLMQSIFVPLRFILVAPGRANDSPHECASVILQDLKIRLSLSPFSSQTTQQYQDSVKLFADSRRSQ
jgi:hypothetical protein